jgi:hypothetical protein
MHYYVVERSGKRHGPYSKDMLKNMLQEGTLQANALLEDVQFGNTVLAGTFSLARSAPPKPSRGWDYPLPNSTGGSTSRSERAESSCGGCVKVGCGLASLAAALLLMPIAGPYGLAPLVGYLFVWLAVEMFEM